MVLKKKRKTIKRKAAKKQIIKKRIRKPTRKITKREAVKKTAKKAAKKAIASKKIKANIIGTVMHYFPKVRAAVVKLKAPLTIGDVVKVKGHTTDFTQNVTSIQIDRVPITSAKKGQEIGLLVESRVRRKDVVYKA
jgi:hypothetical protein